jgi:hypothetical protein
MAAPVEAGRPADVFKVTTDRRRLTFGLSQCGHTTAAEAAAT